MRRILVMLGLILPAVSVATVEWSAADAAKLSGLEVGDQTTIVLPSGSGESRAVAIERFDPYARDTRIWVVDAGGTREVPRSLRLHFLAKDGVNLALHMDPDGSNIGGIASVDGELMELFGAPHHGGVRLWLEPVPTRTPEGEPIDWSCDGSPHNGDAVPDLSRLMASLSGTSMVTGFATRQAVVAVDTDNEFMQLKFSDNTTNATNYLAALFTGMNVMYEDAGGSGGLQLRLVQGHTILRVSSTADPYTQSDPSQQLVEFGGFWRNNLGAVDRAFAMLLSGKSASPNSASGIAWVLTSGNYCLSKGSGGQNFGHYSVTQVFRFAGSNASHDVRIIAHELGHNLGAFHTHCTAITGSAPTGVGTMDQCFSGETVGATACYSGSVSCPGGGAGTIMSYCHFNPPNCGQAMLAFHSGHVTTLGARIAANYPACITDIEQPNPDIIFANGFE